MAANKQRIVWTSSDESALIDLWRERAGDFRRGKRNLHIYADISAQMPHKFTTKEVHIKIRNLTQRYREEKKRDGPSEWKHFDAVHQIIGRTAANNADTYESFTRSSTPTVSPAAMSSPVTVSETLRTPPLSPLPSSSKSAINRKRDYMGELVQVAKEQNELLKALVENGNELTRRVVNAIEQQNNTSKEFINIMKIMLEKF